MKKLLLTIISLVSLAAYAQKDLEVTMLLPENGQVIVNNTTFTIAFSVKNLGPDTVFPTDSFQVGVLLNFNVIAGGPSLLADTLAVGDSAIFSIDGSLPIEEDDSAIFCGVVQFNDTNIVDDLNNNLDCTIGLLRRFNTGVVETASLAQSVKAYPNPANSYFTITMNASDATVEVMDITGKSVETAAVTMGEARMDVSNYKNGVYFYHIRNAAGSVVKSGKFTVSH